MGQNPTIKKDIVEDEHCTSVWWTWLVRLPYRSNQLEGVPSCPKLWMASHCFCCNLLQELRRDSTGATLVSRELAL